MEWKYKGITIYITREGNFNFMFNGKAYECDTLRKAKKLIDEKTAAFYKMSRSDMSKLLNKLNNKERTFVAQLISELGLHANTNYCDAGISEDFLFECDFEFDKINEI